MSGWQIALIVAAVLLLGLVLLPAFNRWQVRRMPADQQILLIMKQAKGLHYIRNVSGGKQGFLYYVKNKRKILVYPWVCRGRVRVITKKDPFDRWDYPEEQAFDPGGADAGTAGAGRLCSALKSADRLE